MESHMRSLAAALSAVEMKYKFSVAPHPDRPNTFRLVFSRPTFQTPESRLFVAMDAELEASDGNSTRYRAYVERSRWPLHFTVSHDTLESFPEHYVDMVWEQKQAVRERALLA